MDGATKENVRDAYSELRDEIRSVRMKVERVHSGLDALLAEMQSWKEQTRLSTRIFRLENAVCESARAIRSLATKTPLDPDEERRIHALVPEVSELRQRVEERLADYREIEVRVTEIEKLVGVRA